MAEAQNLDGGSENRGCVCRQTAPWSASWASAVAELLVASCNPRGSRNRLTSERPRGRRLAERLEHHFGESRRLAQYSVGGFTGVFGEFRTGAQRLGANEFIQYKPDFLDRRAIHQTSPELLGHA